jgi:hypothetical protein
VQAQHAQAPPPAAEGLRGAARQVHGAAAGAGALLGLYGWARWGGGEAALARGWREATRRPWWGCCGCVAAGLMQYDGDLMPYYQELIRRVFRPLARTLILANCSAKVDV